MDLNKPSFFLGKSFFQIQFRPFCCFCCFLHFGLLVQDVGHQSINTDAHNFCSARLPLIWPLPPPPPHSLSRSLSVSLCVTGWLWREWLLSPSKLASGADGVWFNDIVKKFSECCHSAAWHHQSYSKLHPETPASRPTAAGLQQIKGWSWLVVPTCPLISRDPPILICIYFSCSNWADIWLCLWLMDVEWELTWILAKLLPVIDGQFDR